MAEQIALENGIHLGSKEGFSYTSWILANGFGLGIAYGLFALFGDGVEALGADHGSIGHGLAAMAGLFIGGTLFVVLRYRILAAYLESAARTAIAAGIGFTAGFVVGFMIAGPPVDFLLGIIALGTIGGSLQWRTLRYQIKRPGSLLLVTIGGWLLAAVAAVAVAILAGGPLTGVLGGGLLHFVAITGFIGFVAGAFGGTIEGHSLRTRIAAKQ